MKKSKILWIDDEIEILRPHIYFLTGKGYEVETCTNGNDATDLVRKNLYDLVLLDEHMPGLSGIETLRQIKRIRPGLPVVMVTKSEEEALMEEAIGSEIADYLIKPVKPNQVLLALKKNLDQKRLVTEITTTGYRQEFTEISGMINRAVSIDDWYNIYRKLTYWELELDKSNDPGMHEILNDQVAGAESAFCRFVAKNYLSWLTPGTEDAPLMSHRLMKKIILPAAAGGTPLFMILIDNLRYDQWKIAEPEISGLMRVTGELLYTSILPTTTQFARNAVFSGLMPLVISKTMPGKWIPDYIDEEGKNIYEEDFIRRMISLSAPGLKWSYHKINNSQEGRKVNERFGQLVKNNLNILVYNFVDILSHARTESGVIRDLATDERAFRNITRSWFIHSPIYELIRMISQNGARVVLTTDHGSIKVKNPVRVVGDRESSPSLRYKTGRNLAYESSSVFEVANPQKAFLPSTNISSRFIFALNRDYLVYQNKFNQYAAYYRDTFQHGGVSMQEMILPVVFLEPLS